MEDLDRGRVMYIQIYLNRIIPLTIEIVGGISANL